MPFLSTSSKRARTGWSILSFQMQRIKLIKSTMNQRKVRDGLVLYSTLVGWYFSSCTEAVTRVTLGALAIEGLEVGSRKLGPTV